ncbi:MAG: hypothetical protein AMXMBFR56_65920 [Polyangiaceae bacterium]
MRRETHPTLTPVRALRLLLDVQETLAITQVGPASATLSRVRAHLFEHVLAALTKKRRARRG